MQARVRSNAPSDASRRLIPFVHLRAFSSVWILKRAAGMWIEGEAAGY